MKNSFRIVRDYGLILWSLLFCSYALANPVKDDSLDSRLTKTNHYTVEGQDTLKKVAFKLWGHRSWWEKLYKNNSLDSYGARDILPEGLQISYLSPDVTDSYEVKENDVVSRVIYWKYGADAKNVIEQNLRVLQSAHLIQPGFKIYFDNKKIRVVGFDEVAEVINFTQDTYTVGSRTSVETLSYRLYGRKKYWRQIVIDNPNFKGMKATDRILRGQEVIYYRPVKNSQYRVRIGDTLSRMAIWFHGDIDKWKHLYELNKEKISDPDMIYIDQSLKIKHSSLAKSINKDARVQARGEVEPVAKNDAVIKEKSVIDRPRSSQDLAQRIETREAASVPHKDLSFSVGIIVVGILAVSLLLVFIYYQRKQNEYNSYGSLPSDGSGLNTEDKDSSIDLRFRKELFRYQEGQRDRRPLYTDIAKKLYRKITGRFYTK